MHSEGGGSQTTQNMTPVEAIEFITLAAWEQHQPKCQAIGEKGIFNHQMCNCGATRHNEIVKEALLVIGKAADRKR